MMNIFEFNPFSIATGQLLLKMRQKNLKAKLNMVPSNEELDHEYENILKKGEENLTKEATISAQMIKDRQKIRMLYDTGIMDAFDNPDY
jgi:hypothetical protein